MRTWDWFKITSDCICDRWESGELGDRRKSRLPCVTSVVETSCDRVAKHQWWSSSAKTSNSLNTLTISAKSSAPDHWSNSKCWSWLWVECKCMEFVAAGWCTGKWLRLYDILLLVMSESCLWLFNFEKPDWKRSGLWTSQTCLR